MDTMERTFQVNGKKVTVDVPVRDGLTRKQIVALAYPDGIDEEVRVWWYGGDDNRAVPDGSRFFPGNGCFIEVVPNSKL